MTWQQIISPVLLLCDCGGSPLIDGFLSEQESDQQPASLNPSLTGMSGTSKSHRALMETWEPSRRTGMACSRQFGSFQALIAPRNGIVAKRMLDMHGTAGLTRRVWVSRLQGTFGEGKAKTLHGWSGRISPVRRCLQESNPTWDEQEQENKGG